MFSGVTMFSMLSLQKRARVFIFILDFIFNVYTDGTHAYFMDVSSHVVPYSNFMMALFVPSDFIVASFDYAGSFGFTYSRT